LDYTENLKVALCQNLYLFIREIKRDLDGS